MEEGAEYHADARDTLFEQGFQERVAALSLDRVVRVAEAAWPDDPFIKLDLMKCYTVLVDDIAWFPTQPMSVCDLVSLSAMKRAEKRDRCIDRMQNIDERIISEPSSYCPAKSEALILIQDLCWALMVLDDHYRRAVKQAEAANEHILADANNEDSRIQLDDEGVSFLRRVVNNLPAALLGGMVGSWLVFMLFK